MTRTTNLRDMDAPAVGSGKDAMETVLKGTASKTDSEKEGNTLTEYTTDKVQKGALGGENAFK